MTQLNDALRQTDWDLFDIIGAALHAVPKTTVMEYRPVRGWPFAWLLHPGLSSGLTVGDSTSIFRLRETGLINVFRTPASHREDRIALTPQGKTLVEHRRQALSGQSGHERTGNPSLPPRSSDGK